MKREELVVRQRVLVTLFDYRKETNMDYLDVKKKQKEITELFKRWTILETKYSARHCVDWKKEDYFITYAGLYDYFLDALDYYFDLLLVERPPIGAKLRFSEKVPDKVFIRFIESIAVFLNENFTKEWFEEHKHKIYIQINEVEGRFNFKEGRGWYFKPSVDLYFRAMHDLDKKVYMYGVKLNTETMSVNYKPKGRVEKDVLNFIFQVLDYKPDAYINNLMGTHFFDTIYYAMKNDKILRWYIDPAFEADM